MSNADSGMFYPIKAAYGAYIGRWHAGLFGDTRATREFAARPLGKAAMFVAGRMIDQAEEMLESYRKNENTSEPGKNSVLPIALVAMAKDAMPVMGDIGHQIADRMMVRLADGPGAAVYGYRQGYYEWRTQIVVAAADEPSAHSLAAQFTMFVAAKGNRRFMSTYQWGEYTLQMPVTIETPDVTFMAVQTDAKNLTMLAGDVTLRALVPFLDAPKDGEPNDGSNHNPPGYPVTGGITLQRHISITDSGIQFAEYR